MIEHSLCNVPVEVVPRECWQFVDWVIFGSHVPTYVGIHQHHVKHGKKNFLIPLLIVSFAGEATKMSSNVVTFINAAHVFLIVDYCFRTWDRLFLLACLATDNANLRVDLRGNTLHDLRIYPLCTENSICFVNHKLHGSLWLFLFEIEVGLVPAKATQTRRPSAVNVIPLQQKGC